MPRPRRAARKRKYRLLYAVTRGEYYEIEASGPEEAKHKAFGEGEITDDGGEATNVIALHVEEIAP